jgi:hypothetical protein
MERGVMADTYSRTQMDTQGRGAQLMRGLTLLMLAMASGCGGIQSWQREMADYRLAMKALRTEPGLPPPGGYGRDFQRGYVAGFRDVGRGGDGSPPPLPPSTYASPRFHNSDRRLAAEHWFLGFSLGASAATRAGLPDRNLLPLSPDYDHWSMIGASALSPEGPVAPEGVIALTAYGRNPVAEADWPPAQPSIATPKAPRRLPQVWPGAMAANVAPAATTEPLR